MRCLLPKLGLEACLWEDRDDETIPRARAFFVGKYLIPNDKYFADDLNRVQPEGKLLASRHAWVDLSENYSHLDMLELIYLVDGGYSFRISDD